MDARELITEHRDVWTGAVTHKSGAGRGNNGEPELTGIKKLRELILELAVRGKLVPQDPEDEPASVLLERVAEEKERLGEEGQTRKPKKLPEVTEQDKLFDVPYGWEWVRLGSTCQLENGDRSKNYPNKSSLVKSGIPFVNAGDLQNYSVSKSNLSFITEERFALLRSGKFRDGDILFCLRGSLGKCGVVKNIGRGAVSSSLIIVRPLLSELSDYILLYLKAPISEIMINKYDNGTAQPNLSGADFGKFLIPLPGANEQHRVVEKVDELMALCDRLEHQVGDQLEAHEILVDTLLDALTRSTDAKETAEHWAHIAEQFDTLFTTEASIDKLKQTILQLGVMGRLVPQDPDDEPASILLERIEEEKERLEKRDDRKKKRRLRPAGRREALYSIPSSWEWAKVDGVSVVQGGIQKQPKRTPRESFYPYLRVADVQRGRLSSCKDLPYFELFHGELDQYKLKNGDILIVEGNGSAEEIGRCAIWDERITNCVYQNHLIRIRPAMKGLSEFISLFLNSPEGVKEMKRLAVTTSGLYNLSVGKIRNILVPLPPLTEQRRIIEKVDELKALCDQLKARLGEADETTTHLAEAVVESAVF